MAQKNANLLTVLRNIYQNEYQWSLLKSFAMFFVGVRIAQECVGVEIMPSIQQAVH